MENMEGFNEIEVCSLLAHTLHDHPLWWCSMLPHNSMHSFKQFNDLTESIFHNFDPEALDKKLSKQQKALHEWPMDFSQCFCLFMFEALNSQMKLQYIMDRFEYFLNKSLYPKMKLNFKPRRHTSVMELRNHKRTLLLSQVTTRLPLIK